MKTLRRIEIRTQMDEVLFIRRSPGFVRLRCKKCAGEAEMIGVEEAAAIAGVVPGTIYRWVEARKVHFSESASGGVVICTVSIGKALGVDIRIRSPKKEGSSQ